MQCHKARTRNGGRNDRVVPVQLLILNTCKSTARVSAWQDEVKDEVKVLWLLFRCFLKSLDALAD